VPVAKEKLEPAPPVQAIATRIWEIQKRPHVHQPDQAGVL